MTHPLAERLLRAEIERLARLDPVRYELERRYIARRFRVRRPLLDRAVREQRRRLDHAAQRQAPGAPQLLGAITAVFAHRQVAVLSSVILLRELGLAGIDTPRRLADLLRPFGIIPRNIKRSGRVWRGYRLAQLQGCPIAGSAPLGPQGSDLSQPEPG